MNSSKDIKAKAMSIHLWDFFENKNEREIRPRHNTKEIKTKMKENDPKLAVPLIHELVKLSTAYCIGHSKRHWFSWRYSYLPSGVLLQAKQS